MNILQLSPQFPFPPDDGGRIGIANITKEFSRQGANVTMFCLGEKPGLKAVSMAKPFADVVYCPHSTKNSLWRLALSAVLPVPLYIWKHSGADITAQLLQVLKRKRFDVIHADHSAMAPAALWAKSIQNIPVGLRLHNVEWLIWQRYADTLRNSLKRSYIKRQARLLRKSESELYSKMDVCFAITEENMREAKEIAPSATIELASIGIQPEEWNPDLTIERKHTEAILATTYKWVHNVEGVNWLAEKVLPLVREKISGATLRLLGKEPPAHFKNWNNLGVEVEGYVESVQPYLNRAGIYVAPLFVGSGIRIKIVEAMAMELPVVATSLAAEGISATREQGLFRADTPEEFALTMTELMLNPNYARTVGKAARQYVLEYFTWSAAVKKMIDCYSKLI